MRGRGWQPFRNAVWAARLAVTLALAAGPAAAAERIITLAPHLAEIVCAVGACDELVAVSAYSNYPESVKRLPVIGDAGTLNAEALLALRPTLVLAWGGGTSQSTLALLERLRLPVKVITIQKLDDVAVVLETLAARTGHAPEGRHAAQRYRAVMERLARTHAGLPLLPVFYQIEAGPVYTVNRDSPISEVIQLCGGHNVFATLPTLSAAVSDEAILAAAPAVVLHSDLASPVVERWWARFPQSLPVRQGTIIGIDGDLLARSGPRLAEGATQVCAALDAARTRH